MKQTIITIGMLVGPLLWTTVLPLPTPGQSNTTGSDLISLTDATAVPKKAPSKTKSLPGQFSGNASWYGVQFNGRKTASGEIFDMNKLTGAHRRLPMPTRVLVENPRNGKAVVIRVNDRGPHAKNRIIDLSREAARQIGTLSMGIGFVECLVLPATAVSGKAHKGTPDAGGDKK